MRGNCPGVWPLSPVWSAFHSDQWEGTVPGTGGWGQCHPPDKHHREQLTSSFQTTSIWRKPDSATWLLCLNPQPSLLLSETEHERVPPWNQEPGKPSALPTFVSLSSRMPRAPTESWLSDFRKESHWFLTELADLFKVRHEITQKCNGLHLWAQTDHRRWKGNGLRRAHCFCLEFGNVFLSGGGGSRVGKPGSRQHLVSCFTKDFLEVSEESASWPRRAEQLDPTSQSRRNVSFLA